MSKIRAAKLFSTVLERDVWTLINEAAAKAATNPQRKFQELYNLGQGFFSYSPPAFAISEAKKALEDAAANQYSPTKGRLSLINSLISHYSPIYGFQLGPEHVQVTTGANEGIFACLIGLVNPGDEVIVFEPFFDQYIANIQIPGGVVKHVPLVPPKNMKTGVSTGDDWTIDFDLLKAAMNEKTKAIIVNTPHNPVGKVFTREELLKIGQLCVENDVYIISDEVYEHLYFKPEFVRIATLSKEIGQRTFTVGSAGKLFAATGWRIGWVISENPDLLQLASRAHTRICFSSPSPLQEACAHALTIAMNTSYFDNMRDEYIRKFKIFNKAFDELGLPYTVPDGSYFVVADFSRLKIPEGYPFPEEIKSRAKDFQLAYWLINELGIITIPCTEFYSKAHQHKADTLLRFAVCKEDDYLQKAAERLKHLKEYLE